MLTTVAVWLVFANAKGARTADVAAGHGSAAMPTEKDRGGSAVTGALSGAVHDDHGPVANARVCANRQADSICVTSDPNGAFSIQLPRGARVLYASAANHHGTRVDLDESSAHVDIFLVRGTLAELRGVVRDNGGPIAGALVQVDFEAFVRTDDTGHFRVAARPGWAAVSVTADGYAEHSDGFLVPRDDVDIVLEPEVFLEGTVVDATSRQPVADAQVETRGYNNAVRTDNSGRFRIAGLDPGSWTVLARAGDRTGQSMQLAPLLAGQHRSDLVIEIATAPAFTATLRYDDGTPCTSGRIDIARHFANTNARGVAHVTGLWPGTFTVAARCEAEPSEDGPQRIEIPQVDSSLTWNFKSRRRVRGTVRDGAGAPVGGAILDDTMLGHGSAAPSRVSDRDGHYEISIRQGKRTFTVEAEGFAKEAVTIDTPSGDVVQDITLHRGATVEGRVVDAAGTPQPGARVACSTTYDQTLTDVDGRYRLERVPHGQTMFATTLDGAKNVIKEIEVIDGTTHTLDFVVEARTKSLTGLVVDGQGNPIADAVVTAMKRGQNEMSSTVTDSTGRFTIDKLADDLYSATASRADFPGASSEQVRPGTPLRITMVPGFEVHGTARMQSGASLQDFVVSFEDDSQEIHDPSGRFVFYNITSGVHTVTVTNGTTHGQTTAMIDSLHRELIVALDDSLTITGTVLDNDQRPAANALVFVVDFRSTHTDSAGHFVLDHLPHGHLRIRAVSETSRVTIERDVTTGSIVDLGTMALEPIPAEH